MVSVRPRPLFTPGKDPLPIVEEAVWAPGPVWTGAENLASTGIRSPDRSARSQSLYRLRYPAYSVQRGTTVFIENVIILFSASSNWRILLRILLNPSLFLYNVIFDMFCSMLGGDIQ